MATTTTPRETPPAETAPAERIAELETVVAQLTRALFAITTTHYLGAGGWQAWQRAGVSHQAVLDLHGFLLRHPAPEQD